MIRTTVTFDFEKQQLLTKHIRKYVQHKLDFKYVDLSHLSSTNLYKFLPVLHMYDLRICLNREELVPDHEIPPIVNPTLVRMKSRKSFYYKSENFPATEPLWKFDITRSWTGNTKTEAEQKQKRGDTTYEVELECLNPRALMISVQHDSFYVMCSMLLKVRDLIIYAGCPDFKWSPI
jgi:hypothetical protein